jgi:hypothetical protein
MKTDEVLTIDRYLDQCCVVPKRLSPPAPDARHISITMKRERDSHAAAHGCRCDRWGHPCPDCLERKPQTRTVSADFSSTKQRR